MTALRQPIASADEQFPLDAAAPAPDHNTRDAFAYDDDITPEGISAVRERAATMRPARKYKVIDGYAGDRSASVG